MNKPPAFGRFALLALLTSALACTQTDSLGNGGRDYDAGAGSADASAQSSLGSGGTRGLDAGAGGAPGTDGGAGQGSAGVTGGSSLITATTGGQAGSKAQTGGAAGGKTQTGGAIGDQAGSKTQTGGAAGGSKPQTGGKTGSASQIGGASQAGGGSGGAGGSGGTTSPVVDAGADARGGDVGTGQVCKDPNPAQVTCVDQENQCVPSSCRCLTDGTWACSRDCQGGLPLCDAGVSPDASQGALDGAAGCSVTKATFTVDPGTSLDSYCFSGCGLPLKLFKDGEEVELVDFVRPECGTCFERPKPSCLPSGFPVKDYSYSLSQHYVVDGKCGNQDCSITTCLEPGRYKVVYYVLSKEEDGTCGGTAIEVSAEFDYPQTSTVDLRFPN